MSTIEEDTQCDNCGCSTARYSQDKPGGDTYFFCPVCRQEIENYTMVYEGHDVLRKLHCPECGECECLHMRDKHGDEFLFCIECEYSTRALKGIYEKPIQFEL